MKIEVLGSGCPNCRKLEENVRKACSALAISAHISKVSDFRKIASYGVMATPALVVDGEGVLSGRVPGPEEIMRLIGGKS